ncbi:MAG: HepT-like ribonuclease domain-containing protein [Ferruginibacter sp.]
MSDRSEKLLIGDIIISIQRIQQYTNGFTLDNFLSSQLVIDAVIMNFTVMGEVVSRLYLSFKRKNTTIPFRLIKDFRNKIVHFYFGIDHQILWDIITNELNTLLPELTVLHNSMPDSLFDDE